MKESSKTHAVTGLNRGLSSILLSLLMFPAMSAYGSVVDVVVDFITSTSNNASIDISFDCVSGGTLTQISNPTSSTCSLSQDGDRLDVTVMSTAMDTNGDPGQGGETYVNLLASVRIPTPLPEPIKIEPDLTFTAESRLDAGGADAYGQGTVLHRDEFSNILDINSCTSDTLYGDLFNGSSTGTFGSPCSVGSIWFLDSSNFVEGLTEGALLGSAQIENFSGAYASTATYTSTYSVVLNTTSVVPVPPSIYLLGSGVLGLIGIARNRKVA